MDYTHVVNPVLIKNKKFMIQKNEEKRDYHLKNYYKIKNYQNDNGEKKE